jgi:SRSO17 transposase
MREERKTVADDQAEAGPALAALTAADLADVGAELAAYHAHFAPLFARREQRAWAAVYLRGLLTADVPRKNVEALALRLLGAGTDASRQVRAVQQCSGAGAWDDATILSAHERLVATSLGEADGVLILDGSDVPKRGGHSVGVAAQWCGATGKTDNCQAGVFLGYASRRGYTLLDRQLYVPKPWFTDAYAARRRACRLPADVVFRTKADLAAALVEGWQRRGALPATWLVCDEWFGRHQALLDRVAAAGLRYRAEVPRNTHVWPLREPADARRARPRPRAWVPPRAASGKGRPGTHKRLHPDSPPALPLTTVAAQLPGRRWVRYRIAEGRKGPIVAEFVALRAVAGRSGYREGLPGPEVWVLIRRAVPSGEQAPGRAGDPELKYYPSNAPVETPLAELIRVCGMRWAIACRFAEGKGELGLDDYELRSWPGWHHHMTLVILAHHFLVRLRQRLTDRRYPRPAAAAGAREGGHKTTRSRCAPRRAPLAAAPVPAPQPG